MTNEQIVLEYFLTECRGRENSIKGKHLQNIFGLNNREVRRIIAELRMAGHPICSNTVDGYFYAVKVTEIAETIRDFRSRIREMQAVVDALNARVF